MFKPWLSRFKKLVSKIIRVRGRTDLRLIWHFRRDFFFVLELFSKSYSQIRQDVFVVLQLQRIGHPSRGGFFVEFGATNGRNMSNTFMLEKDFGWKGILSEPAKSWETSLKSNRSCTIDTRCVHSESGKVVEFTE